MPSKADQPCRRSEIVGIHTVVKADAVAQAARVRVRGQVGATVHERRLRVAGARKWVWIVVRHVLVGAHDWKPSHGTIEVCSACEARRNTLSPGDRS